MNDKESIMKDLNEPITSDYVLEKKKFNIWSFIIKSCFVFLIGFVAFYFFIILKPSNAFAKGITKVTSELTPIVTPLKPNYDLPYNFTGKNTTTLSISKESTEDLKDTLNIDYKYDKNKKKATANINATILDKELIANYYLDNKTHYISIKDIQDDYIKQEYNKFSLFEPKLNNTERNKIFKSVKKSFLKHIKDSWFTRKFNINKKPTITTTLTVNNQDIAILLSNMKNDLIDDEIIIKALKIFVEEEKIEEFKNNEIKQEDIAIQEIKVIVTQSLLKDEFTNIEINITTKDNKIKLLIEKKNSNINIKVLDKENQEITTLKTDNINKNKFQIIGYKDNKESFKFQGLLDQQSYYTYTLESINPNETVERLLSYRFKYLKEDTFNYESILILNYNNNNINLTTSGNILELQEEIKVDTTKTIDLDKLDTNNISKSLNDKYKSSIEKHNIIFN